MAVSAAQDSKASPWNADNWLALVFTTGSQSASIMLDGKTFEFEGGGNTVSSNGRRSNVDASVRIQLAGGNAAFLEAVDLNTVKVSIYADFRDGGYEAQLSQ